MTTPVPAGRSNPPAPQGGTGYTHRTWVDDMADALGHVAGIYRDLEEMDTTLHEIKAGRTQRHMVVDARAVALSLMKRGVTFVEATDARYLPVFEAIQRAGGQEEVAQDKRYHDID
jgi:hypothetical protein